MNQSTTNQNKTLEETQRDLKKFQEYALATIPPEEEHESLFPIEWYSNQNARWMKPRIYTGEAQDVVNLTAAICTEMGYNPKGNKRLHALKQILFNLIHMYATKPHLCHHILLSEEANKSGSVQHKIFNANGRMVREIVEKLVENKIVEFEKGKKHYDTAYSSKIKLTIVSGKKWAPFLKAYYINVEQPYNVLYGNTEKGYHIANPSTTKNRRGALLKSWNSVLSSADIRLVFDSGSHMVFGDDQLTYRRIFADGRANLGGRCYADWQHETRKEWRKYFLIDGEITFELDMVSCNLLLSYSLAGIDITKEDRDMYFCPALAPVWGIKDSRKLSKKIILSALNVECGIREELVGVLVKSLTNHKRSNQEVRELVVYVLECHQRKTGHTITIEEVIESVIDSHTPISEFIGNGETWGQLQKLESDILLDVVGHYTQKGIPVLGIHDGCVFPASVGVDEAMKVYVDAIQSRTGRVFADSSRLVSVE